MKAAFFELLLGINLVFIGYKYYNDKPIHNLEYVVVIILTIIVCSEDIVKEIEKLNK